MALVLHVELVLDRGGRAQHPRGLVRRGPVGGAAADLVLLILVIVCGQEPGRLVALARARVVSVLEDTYAAGLVAHGQIPARGVEGDGRHEVLVARVVVAKGLEIPPFGVLRLGNGSWT